MATLEKEKMGVTDFKFVISPYQTDGVMHRVGRPLFGGKNEIEVVAKLQYAFSIGAETKEACGYADISTDSFYRYCKNNPEFRNKIELLQTAPTLQARMTIFKSLQDGNVKTAMWYLERKRPEEFSRSGAVEFALSEKDKEIEYLRRLLTENGIDFAH